MLRLRAAVWERPRVVAIAYYAGLVLGAGAAVLALNGLWTAAFAALLVDVVLLWLAGVVATPWGDERRRARASRVWDTWATHVQSHYDVYARDRGGDPRDDLASCALMAERTERETQRALVRLARLSPPPIREVEALERHRDLMRDLRAACRAGDAVRARAVGERLRHEAEDLAAGMTEPTA